jgi:hypothetical protein
VCAESHWIEGSGKAAQARELRARRPAAREFSRTAAGGAVMERTMNIGQLRRNLVFLGRRIVLRGARQ